MWNISKMSEGLVSFIHLSLVLSVRGSLVTSSLKLSISAVTLTQVQQNVTQNIRLDQYYQQPKYSTLMSDRCFSVSQKQIYMIGAQSKVNVTNHGASITSFILNLIIHSYTTPRVWSALRTRCVPHGAHTVLNFSCIFSKFRYLSCYLKTYIFFSLSGSKLCHFIFHSFLFQHMFGYLKS